MSSVPYGAWPSPIALSALAAGRLRLGDLQCDEGITYWIEGRPAEEGRCVIVRAGDNTLEDVLPAPYSARTWVHEYGGGAFVVSRGLIVFSNAGDKRLHTIRESVIEPLTPRRDGVRYADMEIDHLRNRVLCVVESHEPDGVHNGIGSVDLDSGDLRMLCQGRDFYSSPRVCADGSRVAWLCWDNPNMPWDGTELWCAHVADDGALADARLIAGGVEESIFQPSWSSDGVLHYTSDRSGWWNLYANAEGGGDRNLFPIDIDCGVPGWLFKFGTYGFLADGSIVVAGARNGIWEVHILPPGGGSARKLDVPVNDIDGAVQACGNDIALIAGSPSLPMSVVRVDSRSGALTVLRSSSRVGIPEAVRSEVRQIGFTGWDGATSYAYFYPPRNDGVRAPDGELPPLFVRGHGGPTSATSPALHPEIQFWTSRGFAFADVDYGGSTGYGRPYRQRLSEQQGVVDVGDCVRCAQHLAEQGMVDGSRLLIEGGSAGGYIVLCAMTFHDVFAAGASLFGISDLELLLADTHKFEARYFDRLVGPYPETQQRYHDRSPIHFIDRVRKPLLLLQGLDDPIVPPNQAAVMYEALRDAGVPVAYIGFPGEEHGFRRAENIERALAAELEFFRSVLGITAEEQLPPLDIANL